MPRPRLLERHPDLPARIAAVMRTGATPETAVGACGVTVRSHFGWLAQGRAERTRRETGNPPDPDAAVFLAYLETIEQADAQAELALLDRVRTAAPGWRGALAVMERRWPDRWGP